MIALICIVATLATGPEPGLDTWRHVLPALGDPFEHPPMRALGLSREPPEGVVEKVGYRSSRRRYAQLRYGGAASVRVTVVLDEVAPGEADLYVDADRDRKIEPKDRVAPVEARSWLVPLDVAIVEGERTRHDRRAFAFRLGATGLTFSGAAAGYLEGTVRVAGRDHPARRTDGDGNGRLTDPQDRLWVDLDDDGRWDPVDEQFPYAPVLPLAGARYVARSDEYGRRLVLEPLEGSGTIRLAFARPGASVAELSATLIGRDGSAVGLAGSTGEAVVPVGDYRLGTVTLSLDDPGGGPRWSYVFSDRGLGGDPAWYKVAKGDKVAVDPLGAIVLTTGLEGVDPRKPGDDLSLRPGLYTGDGLLIVTCFRGSPTSPAGDEGPGAEVSLNQRDGRPLATARSGFA